MATAIVHPNLDCVLVRDFPENADQVISLLAESPFWRDTDTGERILLAALKLSNGDLSTLRSSLSRIRRDWPSVLLEAEFPNYLAMLSSNADRTRKELLDILESDKCQYEKWMQG
jgi:hypothetical protein